MNKALTIILTIWLGVLNNDCSSQNLPIINVSDSTLSLFMDKFDDTPRIFGYELPDVKSRKMICFSSYTQDVEGNPNKCPLGSHYDTSVLNLKYIHSQGDFVKLKLLDGQEHTTLFIEIKYLKFE